MKTFLVLALLSFLVQQEPTIYPEGRFCTPNGDMQYDKSGVPHQTGMNKCACNRTASGQGKSCEDTTEATHDPICKQWCHEEGHCACPIKCTMHHFSPRSRP